MGSGPAMKAAPLGRRDPTRIPPGTGTMPNMVELGASTIALASSDR